MNRILLLIVLGISIIATNSCSVCDAPSDDFLEFRLVDNNNKDLFLKHPDFNIDSIVVFSSLLNRETQYTYNLSNSGIDTFFRFSPIDFGNYYDNSNFIIFSKPTISDTLFINSKTVCGKCGCSQGITNVLHESESITSNNHIYTVKVDI